MRRMRPRAARRSALAAGLALAAATLATLGPSVAAAGAASFGRGLESPTGGLRGDIVTASTGSPVAGALVRIPADGLSARSDADGRFALAHPVRTEWPYRRLSVVVTAPGLGAWRIVGAPLWPGDALILHVELSAAPFTDRVRTPAERARLGARDTAAAHAGGDARPASNTCSGWDDQLVPSPTIWVYRTKTGVSEQYDFVFYATHVLPNEWISSWDADALGAGAIAVKTYAAWHTMTGHAYSSGDNCADVRDTIDGLFDPSWTTDAAEQAVYATWGSIVFQSGGLFVAHYFAGTRQDPCAYVTGQYTGWMSQWGTQNCALAHVLWPDIVDTFYDTDQTPTTWSYTRNLLLDPSMETASLYADRKFNATYTWTQGSGADGTHFLHVVPKSGKVATIFQDHSFMGTDSTQYREWAWLRCPVTQPTACQVTLRVLVFPEGGKGGVARELALSVPNDGAWHRYAFAPAPHGIDHVLVRTSVVSSVAFDLDRWTLTAPYGGA